jgi:hypothetical protein
MKRLEHSIASWGSWVIVPIVGCALCACSGGSFVSGDGTGSTTMSAPSGSSGSGGSGGGGGGARSACDGNTRKITTADLFVADFASGDRHGWYDYDASGSLNRLVAASPGAAGTHNAGHLAAMPVLAFGGMGFGLGCWDVSSLSGISFWAKGTAGSDNMIEVQVALPATHAVANGGDCTEKCFDHPSKTIVLTPEYKQYTAAWSELAQAGFGAPAKFDGIIMAINWVSLAGPNVDFWIDEIALYSGSALPGPVGHGDTSSP